MTEIPEPACPQDPWKRETVLEMVLCAEKLVNGLREASWGWGSSRQDSRLHVAGASIQVQKGRRLSGNDLPRAWWERRLQHLPEGFLLWAFEAFGQQASSSHAPPSRDRAAAGVKLAGMPVNHHQVTNMTFHRLATAQRWAWHLSQSHASPHECMRERRVVVVHACRGY